MLKKLDEIFRKYPDRCCIFLVILAAVLPFLPGLNFDLFILDDNIYIGQKFLLEPTWSNIKYHLSNRTLELYSPLVMLSFIPDYAIWGEKLLCGGARLQNILWHACAMVLFYLVLRKLKWQFSDGDDFSFPPAAALFAAVAAAWHPQRVESVVWLAERKDVLVIVLGMAAVYSFISAYQRDRIPVIAPVLLFISLWGVKPMLLSLPFILTAGFLAAEKRFELKRALRFLSGMYLAAALYMLINHTIFSGVFAGMFSASDAASGGSRIYLAAYNILRYFGKTLYPANLNPLYPLTDPAAVSPGYLLLLSLIIWLIAAAVFFRTEKREFLRRTLAVCALMFGLAVFPVCGLHQIGNVDFADRYSYFPSLFIWAAAAGAVWMIYRDGFRYRKFILFICSFYLLVLAAITASYLPAWKNETSQLDAMLNTPKPHVQALKLAATAELEKNNFNGVLEYLAILQSYNNLSRTEKIFIEGMYALVDIACGRSDNGLKRLDSFLSTPDWVLLRSAPKKFITRCILTAANNHLQRRNLHYAANLYLMAAQLTADYSYVDKFNFEGVAMMILGKYAEAEVCFTKALNLSPQDTNIQKNLEAARRRKAQNTNGIANPRR